MSRPRRRTIADDNPVDRENAVEEIPTRRSSRRSTTLVAKENSSVASNTDSHDMQRVLVPKAPARGHKKAEKLIQYVFRLSACLLTFKIDHVLRNCHYAAH